MKRRAALPRSILLDGSHITLFPNPPKGYGHFELLHWGPDVSSKIFFVCGWIPCIVENQENKMRTETYHVTFFSDYYHESCYCYTGNCL